MAVDKYYYEVLGVDETASSAEIRKAYYQKLRDVHPDKGHGDSEAAAQQCLDLGEAYQVLTNSVSRQAYDKYGKEEMSKGCMDDPTFLFGMMLGNEMFKGYVGHLALLSSPPPGFDPELPPEVQKPKLEKIMKELQEEREGKLTKIMKERLEPYVKGQEDDFVRSVKSEACCLSKATFGKSLLHTIGYVYLRQAATEMGKGRKYLMVPFILEWVRDTKHSRSTRSSATKAAMNYIKLREEWRKYKEEDEDGNPNEKEKEIKDAIFNSLWQMSMVDIERTVSHVCHAVLKDSTVSKDVLQLRALGLRTLGRIFQEATSTGDCPK